MHVFICLTLPRWRWMQRDVLQVFILIDRILFVLFLCRGTHGYMAPEVLSKGTAYDSSADWFSFGCMLYKLLKGHSPFRQHKTKDKHEIDRMTLTMVYIIRGRILAVLASLLYSASTVFCRVYRPRVAGGVKRHKKKWRIFSGIYQTHFF